jgi:DNA-binding NarL/FixJ family response regulator
MNSIINIYYKEKIIINWFNKIHEDLGEVYEFNFHKNINSLKNELEIKQTLTIVIIDIENISYSLYTKAYFNNHNHIKFIGIGYKKDVEQILNLIDNNIISYISIEDSGMGLIKAINNAKKGKSYFCDETKDYLIDNYINSVNCKNKTHILTGDDKNVKNNNLKNVKELTLKDVKELTAKEMKVSNLLSQGLSYKEIASILGVTTFAISQNAKSIFKKLNVRSRSELSYRMLT